jgi:hypothetical protein
MQRPALFLAALLFATPAQARDSLGIFGAWGAFRDPAVPRCYAIAMANPAKGSINGSKRETQPYADVGIWPKRAIRNTLHLRLSHRIAPASPITLSLSGQHYKLVGGNNDAWSADQRMDAAIIAAMRSAETMTVASRDSAGKPFSDAYALSGAATAMDAAALGCATR